MNVRVLFSIICCFTTVMVSTCALAQDIDEVEQEDGDVLSIAGKPHRPPWETSVETTWLPGSTVRGTGGDLSMGEVKAGFTRRFSINPRLELSTGVRYSLREIDAPATANLPGSLQTLSLNLGGEYRVSDSLALGLRVSPGLSGDFTAFDTNDIRVPLAVNATYRPSKALTLLGGIAYSGQNRSFPVLPMIGVLYTPTKEWAFGLGFPRTGVMYRPDKKTEYFVAAEFSGGEYHLHDPSIGADIISYRDYRALTGAEFQLFPFARLGISGGYAFARKFVFYGGNRSDVNLDGAPFGRVEVKFMW
jgi:uncharacterized protein DUF6268